MPRFFRGKLSGWVACAAMLCGCAAAPQGNSAIRAEKGDARNLAYLTYKELGDAVRAGGKDDADKEVEIRMAPKGGKLIYDASHVKFALGEQDNVTPFLSVKQNGKEIKLCDESDFKSQEVQTGTDIYGNPTTAPFLKKNEVKFECPLDKGITGEFQVDVLDPEKRVLETYHVTPAP